MSIASNFPAIAPTLNLSFALTKQLDPRITFTRASTATYYGTETAKAEENLLLQSQDFTTTWSNVATSDTADTTVAPDGTTTADTITATGTGAHYVQQTSLSTTGTQRVLSCFVKAGTNNYVQLGFGTSVTAYANFDVTSGAGAVGTVGATATASIVDAGNGWFRCIVITSDATASALCFIAIIQSSTDTRLQSFVAAGTETIILWGCQLEQRSAVTAYTPTTTQTITNYIPVLESQASGVARFDHNPTTFESLGLLIEESRTNLLLRSEDFSATWSATRLTSTNATIIAPSGQLTGIKLVPSTDNDSHRIAQTVTTSAGSWTASAYLKAGEYSGAEFRIADGVSTVTNSGARTVIDLLTGTLSSTSFYGPNATAGSATITLVGNGWYRVAVTVTVTSSASNLQAQIWVQSVAGTGSYAGNGFSGIFIWGTQVELGAFATSYIATVASQVTRAADAASMTGANFSSWYNAGQGTLYAEANTPSFATTYVFADINDGSVSNFIRQSTASNATNTQFVIQEAGVTTASPGVVVSIGSNRKMAGAYAINSVQQSVNGLLGAEDTIATIPSGVSQMNIGARPTGANLVNSTIRKIAYYPIRVSNTNLQALTS